MLATRRSHRRPGRRRVHRVRLIGLGLVASVVWSACSSGDSSSGPSTTAASTSSSTTTLPRVSDGRLTIGVLLPSTGGGAQLGSPLISAVRSGVGMINAAGGVLDQPVTLIEADEGGTAASAAVALESLLSAGVDAIVGPASSLNALAITSTAVSAGIPTCSPTATAMALDEFPDQGLFFRTVPSDSLQAVAIARSAELTGAPRVALAYIDDVFGRALGRAVESELEIRALEISAQVAFSPTDSDLTADVDTLFEGEPGVIIVIADADTGARILSAIGENTAIRRPSAPRVLVNDAIRMARSSQLLRDLPSRLRSQILGISPMSIPLDSSEFTAPYSAHAHDCVNLIALSAQRAGSDDPAAIAAGMVGVSVGGSVCQTFEDCKNRLALGLQIDYLGASGPLRLSPRTGDPTVAYFQRFTFDNEGRDVSGSVFEASAFRPAEF